MKLLAMDTSNKAVSVALLEDHTILGEMTVNIRQTHSQTLLPMINQLLKQTKVSIDEVDRFVVAKGPGSYTGLRIAVTTAKSFAWTLQKELVGLSSLAVLAGNVTSTNALIVPLFDARRDNIFAGGYQWQGTALKNVIADAHRSLKQLLEQLALLNEPVYFVGQEVSQFREAIIEHLGQQAHFGTTQENLPRASVLGLLGLEAEVVQEIHSFGPDYLRQTEAEVNWAKQHVGQGAQNYVEQV